MQKTLLVLSMMILNIPCFSQNFFKLELLRIENKLILPENYLPIKMPEEIIKGQGWNHYDPNNQDTYIEILQDAHKMHFHILLQTDFLGNIKFAAVSNGLNLILNKKEIPKFIFEHCLKELNNTFSNQQENIQIIINCILERLESCAPK